MRYQSFIFTALLSIALPLFTSAEHHGPSNRRHNALANRKRAELQEYHRRDQNSRATFFDVGLGACGKTNVPSDFIVALNSCEYDGGAHCFKTITIEYNGKSTQAQIMDECPGCPCGGLDMSTGLFTFFAPESVGVFYMNWQYSDGGGSPAPSSTKAPSPTSTWVPPSPTTTSSSKWVDPSPWTSQTTTSTLSKSSSSSWSSSSSSSWNSTTWTSHSSTSTYGSHSAAATATVPPTPENLQGMNSLMGELGKLVVQYGT